MNKDIVENILQLIVFILTLGVVVNYKNHKVAIMFLMAEWVIIGIMLRNVLS